MSREAYVKDGVALGNSRASVGCHRSTLQMARTLAGEWGVTLAEALDMALTKSYEQEFGRSPRGKEAPDAAPRS